MAGEILNYRQLQEKNAEIQNGLGGAVTDGLEEIIDAGPQVKGLMGYKNKYDPLENREQNLRINVLGEDDYWGKSSLDEQFADSIDLKRLQDIRARNQSGLAQLGAGVLKFGSTAVTTFLDGTVGTLWGLTEGLANIGNDSDDKSFFQHLWDNSFNRAMADAQKEMENIAPNYYTEEELTNPWYKNVFTWNFLGDKLLKNAGFTVGAMATMAVPGAGGFGLVGEGLDFASTAVGRAVAASRLYKQGANAAMRAIEAGKKVGGIANKLVHTFISANGEAAIEAINAVKDNSEAQRANIDSWVQNASNDALMQYKREAQFDPDLAFENYQKNLDKIEQVKQTALEKVHQTEGDLGNSVYWANVALLMITNTLEFDKYIKGGYNRQKGIENFILKNEGKQVNNIDDWIRGLASGKASLAIPEEIGKLRAGRVIGGTIGRALPEAFEEMSQNLISDSGQMQAQARVNKAVRDEFGDEYEDSYLAHAINPDVTDSLIDRMKAVSHAWDENFGTWASPGWEEALLGALTGGLGTISVTTNKQGKWNVWQGGFVEEVRRPKEERMEYEEMLNKFNEEIGSDKFRENTRHAVAALGIAEEMQDALNNEDILRFKNKEILSIFNDVLYMQSIGGLDAYQKFYKEMANNVTDEDIEYVKDSIRSVGNGKSYLDTKTNDEIKEDIKSKAQSTYNKIQSALDTYTYNDIKYRKKLTNAAAELLGSDIDSKDVRLNAEFSLREMSAKAILASDLQRRKEELEQEQIKQNNASVLLRGDNLQTEINKIQKKIDSLTESYNTWVKDPMLAVKNTQKIFDISSKAEDAKDAIKALERLKSVKTLQEIADFYHYLDPKKAPSIFEKAIDEADPETKAILEQYKPFIAGTEALKSIIVDNADKVYAAEMKTVEGQKTSAVEKAAFENEAQKQRAGYIASMSYFIEQIVDSFADNPDVILNKKSLQSAIRDYASEMMNNPDFNTSTPQARLVLENTAAELNRIAKQLYRRSMAYKRHEDFSKIVKEEEKKEKEQKKKQAAKPTEEQPKKPQPEETLQSEDTKGTQSAQPSGSGTEVTPGTGSLVYYDDSGEIFDTTGYTEEDLQGLLELGAITLGSPNGTTVIPQEEPETPEPEEIPKETPEETSEEVSATQNDGGLSAEFNTEGSSVDEADDIEDMRDESLEGENPPQVDSGLEIPTPDEKEPDSKPATTSLRATFSKYLKGPLTKFGRLISHGKDGTLERELSRAGRNINISLMQQRHLADFMKAKDGKLNVRYMIVHNTKGQIIGGKKSKKPFILLVTPYDDTIRGLFNSKDETDLTGNAIKAQDKKEYVVVGALNYTDIDPVGEAGFNKISEILAQDSLANQRSVYVVHDPSIDGVDNFIYDMNSGYVVRREEGENENVTPANVSLKTLLDGHKYPQTRLTYGDLRWIVFTGNSEVINTGKGSVDVKRINFKKEDQFRYPTISTHPGKVYLYVRASNGVYIPQYVMPVRLRDVTSNSVTARYDKLLDAIVDAKNVAERKSAFAALRKMLVFNSKLGSKGTNIFYNEQYDTISASVADQMLNNGVAIPFTLERNQMKQALDKLIRAVNPRISINIKTLVDNPGYYIDNDLIKVNLRMLGTVEATAFAYPVDNDAKPILDFKRKPVVQEKTQKETVSPVFINTEPYYLRKEGENTVLYDKNGVRVTENEVIDEAFRQRKLQQMKKDGSYIEIPGVKSKSNRLYSYYIVDYANNIIYTERSAGSFERLDDRNLSIFQSRWSAYKAEQESKELAEKQLAEVPPAVPAQPVEQALSSDDRVNVSNLIDYIVKSNLTNDQSPREIRSMASELFTLAQNFTPTNFNNFISLVEAQSKSSNKAVSNFANTILNRLGKTAGQNTVAKSAEKKTAKPSETSRKNTNFGQLFNPADSDWQMMKNDLLDILEEKIGDKYPNLKDMSETEIENILADPSNTYHQMFLQAKTKDDFQAYLDKIDECGL